MLPLLAVCACEYANFLSYHHKLEKRDVICAVYFACYPALFVKIFMSWLPLVVGHPQLGGEGRREEERNVRQGLLDMDGTSTKYEAYLPTTPLMLTSSTTLQRSALLNPIICRQADYFLLFSKKYWEIALLKCALTVALRVINTTTDSKKILISLRAFGVLGAI